MTTATREEEAEEIYESRLQAFNSVSTIDTRSLFGHSVIPDDESLFSSRRSMSSSGSSSVYDDDDDDDDDLHAPTGIDVEALKAENVQLKEENGELKQAIEELNAKLDALTADAE